MLQFIDKPPHHLSFGQKRKVAIASVLASEPELLVLDEPSSNLDPASRRELIDILKNLDVSINNFFNSFFEKFGFISINKGYLLFEASSKSFNSGIDLLFLELIFLISEYFIFFTLIFF